MARSRSRGTKTASRQTRATSRKKPVAAATTEAEVVEDAPGIGMEGAVAIITAVVLFAGCLFLDYELGSKYGGGIFF
jgi:hypothetical protein